MIERYHRTVFQAIHLFVVVTLFISALALPGPQPVQAASIDFPGPDGSGMFGTRVYSLPNGNFVVTDPAFSPDSQVKIGAVYLYNGSTHALISRLTGSTDDDLVGSGGVTILNDGNFVVVSPRWINAGVSEAGAVTWCSATLGCPAQVTAENSLVGSSAKDHVGTTTVDPVLVTDYNNITPVDGAAYLVRSPGWNNYKGAVTYCANGSDPNCFGPVSSTNSLVGVTSQDYSQTPAIIGDYVGQSVTLVPNQGYIVNVVYWDNGSMDGAGAVVLCPTDAGYGCSGAVSTSNSLYGTDYSDGVGSTITLLKNGDFVVESMSWGGGLIQNGAVTYCASLTDANCIGKPVTSANSLTAPETNSIVAGGGVSVLPTGDYIVKSPSWRRDGATRPGAATFCSVSGGVSSCTNQVISASNSLIGDTDQDNVGSVVVVLSNGAFLVGSSQWHSNTGAVTYCASVAACIGQVVSASNSLVGTVSGDGYHGDQVSNGGIAAFSDGDYLVSSGMWNDKRGAVVYCPSTGCTGQITAANSLTGTQVGDKVGEYGAVQLSSGAFLVNSPSWTNGSTPLAGAVTFCATAADCMNHTVSVSNSLVTDQDFTFAGSNYFSITPLSDGSYLVGNFYWANGAAPYAGSLTLCPATGCQGMTVDSANSLVGSHEWDSVGGWVEDLGNGFYVSLTSDWQNDTLIGAGAVTLCNISTGCTGPITSDNSVVGGVQGFDYYGDGSYFYSYINHEYDAVKDQVIVGLPLENKIVFFIAASPATTNLASDITKTGATLNGTINANGVETTVTFDYGLTTDYGNSVAATPGTVSGSSDTLVSAAIGELSPSTVYHFRVVATSADGTVTGLDQSFTTAPDAPTAATYPASSVTSTGAGLNGTVNARNASTTATFEYGLTTGYGISVPADQNPVTGTSDTPVSKSISGLTPNTEYHYRLVADSLGGTSFGSDHTFTTPKSNAGISLGNVSQVYNGSPRAVSETTTPAGLPVAVTYTGAAGTTYPASSTPPTDAGSYTVTVTIDNDPVYQGSTTGGLTISPRPLTVSATGIAKSYDGTSLASVTLASDEVSGDDVLPSYSSATFNNKAVGPAKTITVSGITISGADAPNYSFNTTATTTAAITTRPLTVTATGVNKVYDGTVTATVDLSSNKITGDDVTANYTSAVFDDPSVAIGKSVTVTGISISGADAGNYSLSNLSATTTANITLYATTTTVSANKPSSVYREPVTFSAVVAPATATGKVVFQDNGSDIAGCIDLDLVGGAVDCVTDTLAVSATPHAITASYSGDANYSASTTSTLTHPVGRAPTTLQVAISPDPAIYGNTLKVDVTVTSGALVPSGTVNLTVDSNAPLSGSLTGGQTTFNLEQLSAGTDTLFADYAGTSDFQPSSASQTQNMQKASTIIHLSGLTQTYTGKPLPVTVTTEPADITVEVTYAGELTSPSAAGSYAVLAKVVDPNYSSEQAGTLQIAKARLKVTADNMSRRVGETNPSFTYGLSGFVAGETLSTSGVTGSPLLSSTAVVASPVGQYPISGAAGSLSAQNYTFQFVKGTLIVHTPPSLAIPIADQVVTTAQPFILSLAPDTFEDADPGDVLSLSATLVDASPLPGWLTFSPTTRTFTGAPPASGTLSIQLRAVDRYGDSATAGFKLNVVSPPAQNHAPQAVNDAITTPADLPAAINLLANDSDPDGDPLFLTSISTPSHGTLLIEAGGQVTFHPDPLFSGIEEVVYLVNDGRAGTALATLTLTTTAVLQSAVGLEDAATTLEDTPVDIPVIENDRLPSGADSAVLSIQEQPLHGSVVVNPDRSVTYIPNSGFSGLDTFAYLLETETGSGTNLVRQANSEEGSLVQVSVVVGPDVDEAVAIADEAVTQQNVHIDIDVLVNDSVSTGVASLLGIQQVPTHGQVTINPDNTLRYTPDRNFSGTDHFTYNMGNGSRGFDTAQVTIDVQPVNQTPIAVADVATVKSGSSVTIDVLANDSDVEDATLQVISVTQGKHGQVAITAGGDQVTYTPDTGITGEDRFLYTITDSAGAVNFAQVTVQIEAVPAKSSLYYFPIVSKANVTIVYNQDFSSPAGSEWSLNRLSTSPTNEKFLGEFGNDTVNLRLASLPVHSKVRIVFDLYILRSWDGNQNGYGPDQWLLKQDGKLLLQTTFSNQSYRQAFPGSYPGGDFPSRSTAAAVNSLGYNFGGRPMDTIYHLDYTFDHQDSFLTLTFAGLGLQALQDESWGLDNVKILTE